MHDAAHAGAPDEATLYPDLPSDFEGERRNGIAFLEHDQTSGPTGAQELARAAETASGLKLTDARHCSTTRQLVGGI
jgi:hypothetical protein